MSYLYSQEPTDCHSHNVTGHLPDFWGFVKDADYAGQRTFHERQLDCWVQRVGEKEFDLNTIRPFFSVVEFRSGARGVHGR